MTGEDHQTTKDAHPARAGLEAAHLIYARQARADYRAMIPQAGAPEAVGEVSAILIPCAAPTPDLPARLYRPLEALANSPLPVILFLHGGGWLSGDLDTHDGLARGLANRTGALVLAIDYRLSPEHRYPSALQDCRAAVLWLASQAGRIGGDPNRFALAGDSAGGNLCAALSALLRDEDGPRPVGQLLLYPNVASHTEFPSWSALGRSEFPPFEAVRLSHEIYMHGSGIAIDDPRISPLEGSLRDIPPTLVIAGGNDPLKDEGRLYAEKLRAAGGSADYIEYAGARHGFVQFYRNASEHPSGEQALDAGAAFLRAGFLATEDRSPPT